jgi:hypothetical protein
MLREGTLHIVWTNRRLDEMPVYRLGFADNTSPGGAMSSRDIKGELLLRTLLSDIGLTTPVIDSIFVNLRAEGSISILGVRMWDDKLVKLGIGVEGTRTGKDKVESAIRELKQQGHAVEPIIRENGTMWFQVDRHVLVAWKEMVGLADRYYSFDQLLSLYKSMIPVRFTVFFEPDGPVLSYSVAAPYTSASFSNKNGAKFESVDALRRALTEIELPADEIVDKPESTKVYTLRGSQILYLNLSPPPFS